MESWALKKGSNINTWKKRFLVFEARSRTLGYFTGERDSKQLGAVIVTNCVGVADRLGKREHRVDIECNEGPTARTLCLAFESLELKSQWLACLVEAVESAGPTASGLRPTISFNVSADSADGSDEGDGEDDGDIRSQGGEQESSLRSPWKTIQRAQRTVSQWQQPAAPGWQRQSQPRPETLNGGDVVFLTMTSDEGRSFSMAAEGFSQPGVFVSESQPVNVQEGLFRVCHPLSYDAKKLASKARLSERQATGSDAKARAKAACAAYDSLADKESIRNAISIEQKCGKDHPLAYGRLIQLQHIKSGKFIQLLGRSQAEQDPDCLRVELVAMDDCTEGSHFRLSASLKMRSAGSSVFVHDDMKLLSLKPHDYCLHANLAKPDNAEEPEGQCARHEVNLVGVFTSNVPQQHIGWQMALFSRHIPPSHPTIPVGAAVRFFHPQLEAFLSYQSNGGEQPKYPVPCFQAVVGGPMDPVNRSSSTLFVIEDAASKCIGGVMSWQRSYCLKHLATSLYLTRGDSELRLEMTTMRSEKSVFRIKQGGGKHSEDVTLSNGEIDLWLGNGSLWVIGRHSEDTDVYKAARDRASSLAASQLVGGATSVSHSALLSSELSTKDTVRLYLADSADVADAECILSKLQVIRKYIDEVGSRCSAALGEPAPLREPDVRYFAMFLQDTLEWMCADADPFAYRQKLARELHLIDGLFWALVWPFRQGCYDMSCPGPALTGVQILLSRVIRSVAIGNLENQLYIAGAVLYWHASRVIVPDKLTSCSTQATDSTLRVCLRN